MGITLEPSTRGTKEDSCSPVYGDYSRGPQADSRSTQLFPCIWGLLLFLFFRKVYFMQNYSLITQPWIKIKFKQGNTKEISLQDLFKQIDNIQSLDGDMATQNLAIFRLILALVTTVYQRVNSQGQKYNYLQEDPDFIDIDSAKDELLTTWQNLYQSHDFSQVLVYLAKHQNEFNFINDKKPFYQVTKTFFDAHATSTSDHCLKSKSGTGIVSNSLLNRQICQSNNSLVTYAPVGNLEKNDLSFTSFIRWIIAYQSFTSASDKNKLKGKKYSKSTGYLYSINPVFVKGSDFVNTLLLNLVLFNDSDELPKPQPIWEQTSDQILHKALANYVPDNIPELYTWPARFLFISPDLKVLPLGLPKIDTSNLFVEPMTTWHYAKKTSSFLPSTYRKETMNVAMWRNFGEYVNTNSADLHNPGIVSWIHLLEDKSILPLDFKLNLQTAALIKDGNPSSQMPIFELHDNLALNSSVVFGPNGVKWQTIIENIIDQTQKASNHLYGFGKNIESLRHLENSSFAGTLKAEFYRKLNKPFRAWLNQLDSKRDATSQIQAWQAQCYDIAKAVINNVIQTSTLHDYILDANGHNIFNYQAMVLAKIKKDLSLN